MKIVYILLILLLVPVVSAVNMSKTDDLAMLTNKTYNLAFTLWPDIQNYIDGEYWPEKVTLTLFTDRTDNNLSISKCGNKYYNTYTITGDKTVIIPVIAYYPTHYIINYSVEGKDSKVSYLMNLYATGEVIDFNSSSIFCPKVNTSQLNSTNYKRRIRYGFDPTINIPKERLKNHSLGIDKIVVNTSIKQNLTIVNISPSIYQETNISNNNTIINNSLVFDNQDEINKESQKFILKWFIIICLVSGIILFIVDHYNRYKINRREKPLYGRYDNN